MNLKYILIAFMAVNFLSNAEKIHDIYNFITDLQDASVVMETSLRTQFNTFFGERVKSVATLTTILKNIQNQMPELDKYKSIEVGLGIVDAFERNTNVVRKNVLFSVKAEMDQGKTTYSNILYDYLMDNYGFVDHVARSSKNLFNEGKGCVIAMKTEMLSFIDLTGKKYMECIKNVSISHPIQPSKFLTYQTNLTTTYNTISYKLKEPFWYIWLYSTKAQNDTAAEKLNKVIKISCDLTLS